jgi:hypothetical protein
MSSPTISASSGRTPSAASAAAKKALAGLPTTSAGIPAARSEPSRNAPASSCDLSGGRVREKSHRKPILAQPRQSRDRPGSGFQEAVSTPSISVSKARTVPMAEP